MTLKHYLDFDNLCAKEYLNICVFPDISGILEFLFFKSGRILWNFFFVLLDWL